MDSRPLKLTDHEWALVRCDVMALLLNDDEEPQPPIIQRRIWVQAYEVDVTSPDEAFFAYYTDLKIAVRGDGLAQGYLRRLDLVRETLQALDNLSSGAELSSAAFARETLLISSKLGVSSDYIHCLSLVRGSTRFARL